MGKIKKIFIKNELLEELESSKKGDLDSDLKLKLKNGLNYQLIPAIKFTKILEGNSIKKLEGKFFTHDELIKYGYDIYMNTAIIDESTVYLFDEGFSGVLIEDDITNTDSIDKQIQKSIKEHRNLRKTMLSIGNNLSRDVCDCYSIDILLEHFMKLLGEHLERENKFLYNDFKDSPKLKLLTKIYVQSMGFINVIISEYYNKWLYNITDITTDSFFEETKDIIRILNDRIRQEEDTLFPALLK